MIEYIDCNRLLNEDMLKKQKNYLAMTEFRRELANRGFNVNGNIIVDFTMRAGQIMVSSYPPAIWKRGMRTISFRHLDTTEYKDYVRMRDHYRKTGGIKVKSQDPLTGEVRTEQYSKSGLILPK